MVLQIAEPDGDRMTASWHETITRRAEEADTVVSVIVAEAAGSAPRGAGAWMLIGRDSLTGTIGGGRLEWEAIATAREMLDAPDRDWLRDLKDYPLGPALEQCCGGFVRLLFERVGTAECAHPSFAAADRDGVFVRPVSSGQPLRFVRDRKAVQEIPLPAARIARAMLSGSTDRQTRLAPADNPDAAWLIQPVEPPGHPLYLYGAGHVGRALVRALDGLPFDIRWIDTHDNRFPADVPAAVGKTVTPDPADIVASAPAGAFHLVLTYSHQMDYDICHALLTRNEFGFAGLIGSATKRARFFQRFRADGIGEIVLARLTCPIGIEGIRGKAPAAIAISVAAQLLNRLSATDHLCGRDEYVAAQ